MPRRVPKSASLAALLLTVAALSAGGAASASAATQLVTNVDFETGTLFGWQASRQTDQGAWVTYSREEWNESGGSVPAFPQATGEWAARDSFAKPDTAILSQEVAIPAGTTDELSMSLFYSSETSLSTPSPDTLTVNEEGGRGNQQLRVDVLRAGAPLSSLESSDVLATVFATQTGSPADLAPTTLHADLSPLAGQTVVLRVANAAEEKGMEAGVDDVSILSEPIAPILPPPVVTPAPSNDFTPGRLALDRKHGSARLTVTLPDAGTLNVFDARHKVAIATVRANPGERPILIRNQSVKSSGPQTLQVSIRPTAAAKKRLRETGRLPFHLQLTFTPFGGQTAGQGYAGTLRKTLRPAPR